MEITGKTLYQDVDVATAKYNAAGLKSVSTIVRAEHNSEVKVDATQRLEAKSTPDGWHVPSDAEWTELENYVSSQSQYVCGGDEDNIAKALASEEGWDSSTNNCAVSNNPSANNATGFSARPAGFYNDDYNNFGYNANFWSATQYNSDTAYNRHLYFFYATVGRYYYDKNNNGYSVRCVRN